MMPWIVPVGLVALVVALLAWNDDPNPSSGGATIMYRPNQVPEIPPNPGPWSDEVWAAALGAILRGLTLGELLVEVRDAFGSSAEDFGSYLVNYTRDLQAAYPEALTAMEAEGLVPPTSVTEIEKRQRRRRDNRQLAAGVISVVGAAIGAIVGAIATPVAGGAVAGGAQAVAGLLLLDWEQDADRLIAEFGQTAFSEASQWIEDNPEAAAYLLGAELLAEDPDEANQLAEEAVNA